MQNEIIKKLYLIEKRRAKLSRNKSFDLLKETYSEKFDLIKNENTGLYWDKLNNKDNELFNNPMALHRNKIVSEVIKRNGGTILDIGCGSGQLEQELGKSIINKKYFGIDISSKTIKRIKKKFPKGNFVVRNILDLEFKNNYFDVVVVLEVLEHIDPSKVFKVLKKIYQLLKNGGILIASVPLNEPLIEMNGNPNAHVRRYEPDVINTELEMTNFRVLDTKYLYAFHNHYFCKSLITKILLKNKKNPNNIILTAQKK